MCKAKKGTDVRQENRKEGKCCPRQASARFLMNTEEGESLQVGALRVVQMLGSGVGVASLRFQAVPETWRCTGVTNRQTPTLAVLTVVRNFTNAIVEVDYG